VIRVFQAEIADTDAAAVIHPITAEWTPVTAAMIRLEMLAGDIPARQSRALGDLPVGSAVITSGGDLSAQFMIHVIVRSIDEPVTESGIRRGLQNALRRADDWGIKHIATPPLGTGAGNLDAEESAALMVSAFVEQPALDFDIYVDSDYEAEVFLRHIAAVGGTP
jgi:O-acetyl-ADP-ribose deacetylase